MNSTTSAVPPRARRRRRIAALVIGLLLVGVAVFVVQQTLVQQTLAAASASVGSSPSAPPTSDGGASSGTIDGSVVAPSEADGVIRDGDQPTVFDIDRVAVGRLDPALLQALQKAATDAAGAGVEFRVNSGWRSPVLQERMLQDAIVQYGSEAEASRWVATPATSAHVSGEAVDLGPLPTLDWLAQRGSGYGLCQIYANESWHYELRPEAIAQGCPPMYSDPTEDPRMHR